MKLLSSIILLGFLMVTSCAPVKELTVVNETKMNSFLETNNIANIKQLVVNDFATYKKLGKEEFLKIPKVFFFNKEGFSIEYLNPEKRCSQEPLVFLKNFDKNKIYSVDKNVKLDDFIKSFRPANAASTFKKNENTELYVFVNWGSFAKKINEDSINLVKNKKDGVEIYLINIEPQASWNLTEAQIKSLNL